LNSQTPLFAIATFVEAMNAADLDLAMSLYQPDAVFVKSPGVVISGSSALRAALAELFELKPTLRSTNHETLECGDLAFYCASWSLQGVDAGGNAVRLSGRSCDLLRRQANGNWLIAIDNPWGTDILA
jgi:uncharacterized protein (TIGR02246 family)